MKLALASLLLCACKTSPVRSLPENRINGVRFAYVVQCENVFKFAVYPSGDISEEFYNCMARSPGKYDKLAPSYTFTEKELYYDFFREM